MKPHLKYLSYVIRHKWFVLVAGIKTGAPLWRLIIHDWSKFLPSEWFPYVDHFYGPQVSEESPNAFDSAWCLHQNRNNHHWQFWVCLMDDGGSAACSMPESCVREMVADWAGAGRAIHGRWDLSKWYEMNRSKMNIYDDKLVRSLVDLF